MNTRNWLKAVGSLHLIFVAATMLIPYLPDSLRYGYFHHLDLGVEMNVAAWWSGMWLFWAALLALDMAGRLKQEKVAWLILAGIFTALSLDEIGSLHERAGGIRQALPAIVILASLFAGALLMLYRHGRQRLVVQLILSVSLFGVVVLLERLEHQVVWPVWAKGPRAGFEEGLELLGVFGLVWYLNEARNLPSKGSFVEILPSLAHLPSLPALLSFGFLGHIGLSIYAALNPVKSTLGVPSVWYPAAAFFLLFLVILIGWGRAEARKSITNLALSGWFLLNSVASMYLIATRSSVSLINTSGLTNQLYLFFTLQFCALLPLLVYLKRKVKPAVLLGAGTLALSLFTATRLSTMTGSLTAVEIAHTLAAGGFAFLMGILWTTSSQPEVIRVLEFDHQIWDRKTVS